MRPAVVLCENVPGLLGHIHRLRKFIAGLVSSGYQVHAKLLCAAHYGVPATRTRLFIIGALQGILLPKFPEPTHYFQRGSTTDPSQQGLPPTPTVREALAGLPHLSVTEPSRDEIWMGACGADAGKYAQWSRSMDGLVTGHTVSAISNAPSNIGVLAPRMCAQNYCFYCILVIALVASSYRSPRCFCRDEPYGTVLCRPSAWWPCRHPDPKQAGRHMSPREVARLQSCPDSMVLRGTQKRQYSQVGNAVPVRLAEALAAPHETVILLCPPLNLVGVSIGMERRCQQNDSLGNG